MTKLVIIGLGAAGFSAMLAAKKYDKNADITIIDNKDFLLHPCGLPFALEGKVKLEDLKHHIDAKAMNVKLINSEATHIDVKNKIVECDKGKISYDKLIIATGSSPLIPKIKGIENSYTVHSIEDIEKIEKLAKKARKAVIIGAGAIGLEIANSLNKLGLNVSVIEMMPHCLPKSLDADMAEIVQDHLKSVKLFFNEKVTEVRKNFVKTEKNTYRSDLSILAVGVKPNTEIAKKSGIKTGKFGIIVNDKMQTNIKDVYSAGDCVEVFDFIAKEKSVMQLATSAVKQGCVAGINALGGNEKYLGALYTFSTFIDKPEISKKEISGELRNSQSEFLVSQKSKGFLRIDKDKIYQQLEIAATGYNTDMAKNKGFDVIFGKANALNKPEWFPGCENITMKIIADKKGKLLGAQAIGAGAVSRINIISTALMAGLSLKNLNNIETAYCPAVSDVNDVLIIAAQLAIRKCSQ